MVSPLDRDPSRGYRAALSPPLLPPVLPSLFLSIFILPTSRMLPDLAARITFSNITVGRAVIAATTTFDVFSTISRKYEPRSRN